MKLFDFLNEDAIFPELNATNKSEVIAELAHLITIVDPSLDEQRVSHLLNKREQIGSTGIGYGVAIPHAKYPGQHRMVALFARSLKGVDFNAIDGAKVHFFCLLLAPEDCIGDHLKALARVSRLFKHDELRDRLKSATSKDELVQALAHFDQQI